MIKLYQFPAVWGLPNGSPFCFKLENYLRMADLPYETQNGDVRKAPMKKLPYIDDGGTIVADSTQIIHYLKKKHGDKLDAGLTPEQRAIAHALQRLFEESFYWSVVFARWAEDDGFAHAKRDTLEPSLPPILRSFLPGIIRKSVLKQLQAQGTGRHSRDEVYALGKSDLDAVATLLGDKPFFLGDSPASIDASAYAFLGIVLWAPPDNPLKAHLKTLPGLVAYCERMKARYYAR